MKTETKTPTAKTLPNDYAAPFNQILPPGPLSGGQPGIIQHAGLTKREYFAALFAASEIFNHIEGIKEVKMNEIMNFTDQFIKALNE